jgi:tetratricopeptide (TPR) repeat protein
VSRRPRISLCLIARDEEAMLPACLASARDAVDEVVLVDTGSTDRTVAIAREAGALVLSRPWDDDFSAPRNLAARHATGDWVLVLDADERLAPGAGRALRQAVRRGGFDLGMVRLHNASGPDAPAGEVLSGRARVGEPMVLPRVMRRVDGLEWRGAIHESVGEWLLRRRGRRVLLDVDLVHLGYLPSVAQARDKRARNLALLRKRLQVDPEDITPSGYLANELLDAGETDEASRVVEAAWAILDRQPPERCWHRLSVARGVLALRTADGARAVETAARAEGHQGAHPDFDYLRGFGQEIQAMGRAGHDPERGELLRAAAASFRAALERLRRDAPFEFLGLCSEIRARLHLGVVHLLQGLAADALTDFADALRVEPDNRSARVGAAEALLEAGQAARALEVVEPALGDRPDGWLVAAAAAERLGARGDARLFLARAVERRGAGYECPHRLGRHQALVQALAGGAAT